MFSYGDLHPLGLTGALWGGRLELLIVLALFRPDVWRSVVGGYGSGVKASPELFQGMNTELEPCLDYAPNHVCVSGASWGCGRPEC